MNDSRQNEPNRLIQETSPYLLQHAHNPVDWFAWGEEALQAARELDRPIFLSIGYSACHWCHVMEHESFESAEIASVMNADFINIKVDREERPDLDQIYMSAVIALTGRGGWPMSVFLTPDLKPFYGGTYWPPKSRMGMPGFSDVLQNVSSAWRQRREAVLSGADELTAAVVKMGTPGGKTKQLSEELLAGAERAILQSADRTHGGFGGAPKFPHPMDIRLLLRSHRRFGSEDSLLVARLALDKMAAGGIYDHLGGGFHRYSTDARWLVPHFEKMLYDNALLVSTYLEAYQLTGAENYASVVRETLDYVLREMTQPGGGFYSTQDADSEGVEGKFFVWSREEIEQTLGSEEARIFNACYDVTPDGNWEGETILNRVISDRALAQEFARDEGEVRALLTACRGKLFQARSARIAPARDEKVLVSWNGLMIAAMAQAAMVLGEKKYAEAAREAADFILNTMRDEEGRLLHAYKDGRSRFNAYLDDYACLIDGLVDLYQATFAVDYLEAALELAEEMFARFGDREGGGFFYTADNHEPLIVRSKDSQDNATPSGNSMAASALLKLGRICGRRDLEEQARGTLELLSGQLAQIPAAGGQSLIALNFLLDEVLEIVVAEGENPAETEQILSSIHGRFLPNKVLLLRSNGSEDDTLSPAVRPLLQGKKPAAGSAAIYLCEQGSCREPLNGVEALESALSN